MLLYFFSKLKLEKKVEKCFIFEGREWMYGDRLIGGFLDNIRLGEEKLFLF